MKSVSEISQLGIFAAPLERAFKEFGVVGQSNIARALGQFSHESGKFSKVRESLNYAADRLVPTFGSRRITQEAAWALGRIDADVRKRAGSTRKDQAANQSALAEVLYGGAWGRENLGNTQPGDGAKFIGRGLIQTTGRANYAAASKGLFGDDRLLCNPEILEQAEQAARAAVFFYTSRGLHRMNDVHAITKIINPGMLGIDERIAETRRFNDLLNSA